MPNSAAKMACPGNGIYVVQGEMSIILTAMKKVNRWSSHIHQDDENDILIRSFHDLKDVLNQIGDLREVDPNHFLSPFLEVIRSEDTTGPVTSLALSSVNKFLSYGLIDPKCKTVAATVENIAEAVTRARFVGTDQTNDSIVLLKILQVLHTLVLSQEGCWLTNESIIEILLNCFRMCFEPRLNELLRRCAETCVRDMVHMFFSRLPSFPEDHRKTYNVQHKLKMNSGAQIESGRGRKKSKTNVRKISKKIEEKLQHSPEPTHSPSDYSVSSGNIDYSQATTEIVPELQSESTPQVILDQVSAPPSNVDELLVSKPEEVAVPLLSNTVPTSPIKIPSVQHTDDGVIISIEDASSQNGDSYEQLDSCNISDEAPLSDLMKNQLAETNLESSPLLEKNEFSISEPCTPDSMEGQDWTNQQGVRFTNTEPEGLSPSGPYGLMCVHELLTFLASLCNPQDKQNSDNMIHIGLSLITVALEVGADSIGKFSSLMAIIKNDVCRSLLSLLNTEKLAIFAAVLQVSFLLFESLRTHLKFQLERYLTRLTEIIVSDSSKISYEHREIALESVVHLWRIPGLVTELYLNYDCALYCPNLYEELTNLLSKNAFPVTGVYNTHLLSLDALLTVIDSIESHCNSRILNERQNLIKGDVKLDYQDSNNYINRTGTRQKLSMNIPSHEHLMAVKRRKKLLTSGTEHFNSKPKKGIQFLQEHNLLSNPLDTNEVVAFLRENPHLDKKMIGEYISNRANIAILDRFVKSFDFTDLRIDEALRLYLETFRLPGESPLISLVMEHFAEHWHKCNNEPFANADIAFTLAYAVIMLNVDQHNLNVKKQNPMTIDDFKRNLKSVNGGQDFDEEMIDDVYSSIKNEEIVMPAEQTGLVRENYEWKVLLRRGSGVEGRYIHAPNGLLDHDLFSLIWSPTISALSYLFDKTNDPAIYQKAVSGFRKCAMISAHYGMSSDFDNLIVSLCKYTMLHYSSETPDNLTISFGGNLKARLAAKTVFNLAHRHGDIIRESWRNLLDCILQLYRCKLLPKILVEAEDFIELSGKISLVREDIQLSPKTETGLLSSLYSYIALGAETNTQKTPSVDDQEAIKVAQNCIRECHLEQLITESKFLRLDSLQYYIKALVTASYGPEGHVSLGTSYSEDTAVFFLELLLKVVIQNRDRVNTMWSTVKEHIYTLLMGAAACDHHFLVERSVVGLLRLAIRLMHREEMGPMVLQSLRMLLLLKSSILTRVSRQISYGMFELLKTSAANIHSATDWSIIFTLLECVGAGAPPPKVVSKPINGVDSGARSEGEVQVDSGLGNERGSTSDSELSRAGSLPISPSLSPDVPLNTPTGWILVGREGEIQPVSGARRAPPELSNYDPLSMVKCVDSLTFLVRDVVHITPYNFHDCIRCIRTFVEAAANTVERKSRKTGRENTRQGRKKIPKKREERGTSPQGNAYDADESDPEDSPGYQQVCTQLLELMHTLHMRTAQIFRWWAEETGQKEASNTSYWAPGWCPLLQGIARLCSHPNRTIRMSAITYLQRALLMQDLQSLSGEEWEECFTQVLFPLLSTLLAVNIPAIEETRIRAATVLSKVFLHHLTPLQSLQSFPQLWLTILEYMDKYMHADNSDLLLEAVPESLKNLLLVMDSANVFTGMDGRNEIWVVTWDRINSFLPNLQSDLFKEPAPVDDNNAKESVPETKEPVENKEEIELPINDSQSSVVTKPSSPQLVQPSPQTPLPKPGEAVEMSGLATCPTVGSQNWQPPAPIYPHLGQMISTPIGPPCILPVYSGFANLPQQPAPPSAQFFFQDIESQALSSSSSSINLNSSEHQVSSSLLLGSTRIDTPHLPVISPPTSS